MDGQTKENVLSEQIKQNGQNQIGQIKQKNVNFRSFLIIALFLIAAVFAALVTLNIPWAGICCFLALVFCAALLAFLGLKRKKEKYKIITFILCAVLSMAAYFSFISTARTWVKPHGSISRIEGMVESDSDVSGQRYIYLNKVSINGKNVKGRVLLNVDSFEYPLDAGMILSLDAGSGRLELLAVELVDGFKVNGSAFRNNLRYTLSVDEISPYDISGVRNPGVFIQIREFIRKKLIRAMGGEYGGLAYGMLTGDKAFIDAEVKDYFSAAGLSHLLAVSGLHLGFVSAVLMWLFKKLKASKAITACSVTAFLLFYTILAGFSPSVVRAALMSFVGVYVYLFGTRRDMLSSLCFAFCVVVVFAPFYMFEAGFILSVACVYGIVLFYPPLRKAFLKLRFPRFLADALALSLSVQIGLMPASIYLFNTVSIYALLVNAVLMPLIMFTFTAIVVTLLIASVIPPFYLPLTVSGLGLGLIDLVADGVSMLPLARIVVYGGGLLFLCYALYFIISRFVMLSKKPISAVLSILICALLVVVYNPVLVDKASVVPKDYQFSKVSLVTAADGNYLVGDIWSGTAIRNDLKKLKIHSLKAVYVNVMNERTARQLLALNSFFGDFTVYFPLDADYKGGAELLNGRLEITDFESETEFENGFAALFENEKFFAYAYGSQYESPQAGMIFIPFGKRYDGFDRIGNYGIIRAAQYYGVEGAAVYLLNRGEYEDSLIFTHDKNEGYIFNYKKGTVYTV